MREYGIEKLEKGGGIGIESRTVFSYRIHMHSYYEMTLYAPFDGTISVNDKTFSINSPTAILISPSDFHKIDVTNDCGAKFIKLSFDGSILSRMPDFSAVLQNISNDEFIMRTFYEISENADDSSYITLLVNTAVRNILKYGKKILPAPQPVSDTVLNAVRMINENFCGDISLAVTADRLGVTPQYLSSAFKKNIGIGFSEYLCGIRLRRAAVLISETKLSITEICYECGYRSLPHFLRAFKKEFGISPKGYRQNFFNSVN